MIDDHEYDDLNNGQDLRENVIVNFKTKLGEIISTEYDMMSSDENYSSLARFNSDQIEKEIILTYICSSPELRIHISLSPFQEQVCQAVKSVVLTEQNRPYTLCYFSALLTYNYFPYWTYKSDGAIEGDWETEFFAIAITDCIENPQQIEKINSYFPVAMEMIMDRLDAAS